MTKTIFISSTFQDLKTYRSKVWDFLQGYDVNIRGMEQFGARKENSLSTCIHECEFADIYIGIIGMRYGSIDTSTGKSYTMLEYEVAYEKSKDILFFLINENDARIAPQDVDYDDRRSKLDAFKKMIKERHTVAYFMDEEDLIKNLSLSLNEKIDHKKSKESTLDSKSVYEKSKGIIDDFLLMPKALSGKSVYIKCKIIGKPFPASKILCNSFNLDYGKTIGVRISIIEPSIKNFTEYLFIEYDRYDSFIYDNEKFITINTILKFSEKVIDSYEAHFVHEEYYTMGILEAKPIESWKLFSSSKKIVYEPDGTIILQYNGIIEEEHLTTVST